MARANFAELPQTEIAALGGDHPLLDVKTRTPLDAYETIRVFYRGRQAESLAQPNVLGFKSKKTVATEAFDDVLVFVRFRQPEGIPRRRLPLARRRGLPGDAEPGSVMIKLFRNITRLELPTLLPDVQEKVGSSRAWLYAPVLYAVAHVPAAFALRDPAAGPNPLLPLAALACGLLWSFLNRKLGRLTPGIFSHGLFLWSVVMMFRMWGPSV